MLDIYSPVTICWIDCMGVALVTKVTHIDDQHSVFTGGIGVGGERQISFEWWATIIEINGTLCVLACVRACV